MNPPPARAGVHALAMILAIGSVPSAHAAGPSFDCATARGPVESTICTSPRLSRLDVRIDAAYRRARQAWRADGAMVEALRNTQRDFLDDRSAALDLSSDGLALLLAARANLLEALDPRPRSGFDGEWGNLAGALRIARDPSGLTIWGGAAEPVLARWICEVDDTGTVVGTTFYAPPEAAGAIAYPEWSLRIDRIDGGLRVLEVGPPGTETAPDGRALAQTPRCGRRGRLDGHYFPTRGLLRTNRGLRHTPPSSSDRADKP